jgi:ribosomal protein S18 acetylase RimI-like enzyme
MSISDHSLRDFQEFASSVKGAVVKRYHSSVWIDSGASDSFLNAATLLAPDGSLDDEGLQSLLRACDSSSSSFTWWLQRSDARLLHDHRFTADETVTLMELSPAETLPYRGDPIGCHIESSSSSLEELFTAAARFFGDTRSIPSALADQFVDLVADGRVLPFVARRDGAIVGTLLLHLSHEDTTRAGIYWVAVDVAARNHGVATALTTKAIAVAREKGRNHVVLQSSLQAVGLYTQLGFRDVAQLSSWTFIPHC